MRSTQRRRSRRYLFAIAIAVVVIGAGATAVWLLRPPASTPTASTPTASVAEPAETPVSEGDEDPPATEPLRLDPPPRAPLTADEDAEIARVSKAAEQLVEATNEIGTRADGSAVGADAVATGFVLGELQAAARERFDLRYRQVGEARVTEVTTSRVHLDAKPARMTVTVCVDMSEVDVLDEAGNSFKKSLYDPGRPVKHVYGAVFDDGAWKLSSHDIPDDQNCPKPGDER